MKILTLPVSALVASVRLELKSSTDCRTGMWANQHLVNIVPNTDNCLVSLIPDFI